MDSGRRCVLLLSILCCCGQASYAEVFDIFDFDESEEGAWSDIDLTTLTVPLVADGSIQLDGSSSSAEYGSFEGRTVSPGSPDGSVGNAWILGYAINKDWQGADDSEFTFYLAHDTDFLYVGVEVKDDAVYSDNENGQFWKDDAIEIVVDANNSRANVNTDKRTEFFNDYGGHNYVNYEGRFSRWDDDLEESSPGWANEVDWEWGPDGQIYGFGEETDTGWAMETKFHKSQFEDPDGGGPIEIGDRIGFNIGMDDDDGEDLEIQYWWANRARPLEFDAFALEDGDTIADYSPDDYDYVIDGAGRLAHGGTGEIIFGGPNDPKEVIDGITDPQARLDYIHNEMNTWVGDSNCDGVFNSSDFVSVFTAGEYEDAVVGNSTWVSGDWNGDKEFNSSDFVFAFTDGGYEQGKRPAAAVPEPSSSLLMLWGVVALFARRKLN
ncbi:MAG: sugar-binding protein [Pirellulaceae bacterium]|nr:PEP-CTERM sorting domain-containing protein [Planctomycetaceae bacterium]MDG2385515.1 sugar-binding protein [Pirellulaceae bacterium]